MNYPLPFEGRRPLRVLVGCETSGRTRDAFIALGHDAWSCDLLPTKVPGPHIQGDVFDHVGGGWDLGIFHPTCTKLTVAAAWTLYHPDDRDLPAEERRPHPNFPDRRAEQDAAVEDFMRFAAIPIKRKALENPVGVMSSRYRKPDQTFQPYQFGDDASKRTCLWLFDLPKLIIPPKSLWFPPRIATHPLKGHAVERWSNQTDSGQNRLGPSEDRWALRSETYPGPAAAMAEQWGGRVEAA